MGNPRTLKPFSSTTQPTKEQLKKRSVTRKENIKKKRELSDLLNLALKGKLATQINKVLKDEMGTDACTIEEALHFVQIAKAISSKDTGAYMALMQTSGLNKPLKIEQTGDVKQTVIKTSDGKTIVI